MLTSQAEGVDVSDTGVAMVERLMSEEVLSATAAARLLPTVRGKRLHATTVVAWIIRGKRGVRLEGCRGPGRGWWTSRQAVARFLARLTEREVDLRQAPTANQVEAELRERAERARLETMRLREEWKRRVRVRD